MAKSKIKSKSLRVPSKKSPAVPATANMVDDAPAEPKSEITTLRLEIRAEFKNVDSKFKNIDSKFKNVDAQFKNVDAQFDSLSAEILELRAQISNQTSMFHRMMALMEEQTARNIYVLDGYASLEARMTALES